MAYALSLTARAERDLARLYDYIDAAVSGAARKRYLGLKQEILGLEKFPFRCATTPENKILRHLLYGKGRSTYRVIYRVVGNEVAVLHIRHGARKSVRQGTQS
ncbi:MAG TPA: type II toxin-antitoxin system RelE/ParE family toxin [Candidatus Sulfotelmatobacter sp.]|jgi:plasmid stabilization system protein ParE